MVFLYFLWAFFEALSRPDSTECMWLTFFGECFCFFAAFFFTTFLLAFFLSCFFRCFLCAFLRNCRCGMCEENTFALSMWWCFFAFFTALFLLFFLFFFVAFLYFLWAFFDALSR